MDPDDEDFNPPCPHVNDYFGYVTSGDYRTGPHSQVSCCRNPRCVRAARKYTSTRTGQPASDLCKFGTRPTGVPQ